ncbi:hypothetical protein BDN67DRAFT_1012528 [Paxillus ammoniavirescens]|nr:hypothetical protein BDN67DRAFT_1012528 [Paxillus ammoniavirescens]
MPGKVAINITFNKYQINIENSAEEDVFVHFLPSILFILKELDKGRSVLVQCQAGIRHSVTIITTYLMPSQKIDAAVALELIRAVHPNADPHGKSNEGFLQQPEVFHEVSYKISCISKPVHLFYMERAVEEEVMSE